jgi:hypothetical protein
MFNLMNDEKHYIHYILILGHNALGQKWTSLLFIQTRFLFNGVLSY